LGVPPPNEELHGWFIIVSVLRDIEEHQVTRKLHAFMASLLIVLEEHLRGLSVLDGKYPVISP
jgi:hypothetical protein